jgi:myosin-1
MIERKDFECASKIQKAWKKWKLAKTALEQRAKAANLLRGHKERQRDSLTRQFVGDYMNYDDNYSLQEVIQKYGKQELVVFSDQTIKLNRRNRPERRDFIMTDQAFYVVMRAIKDQVSYYKCSRRTALADIGSATLSTLSDNYIVFQVPKEYDHLMETSHKTECLTLLAEHYEKLTRRKLQINFQDNIQYKIKSGDTRELAFNKNESAASAQLKKAGRTLYVSIASGLPRDTDTTPQGLTYQPKSGGSAPGGPARGGRGGGPARGGGGPANNANTSSARQLPTPVANTQQQQQQPATGATRGTGGPARGNATAPTRGTGGPARGGPAQATGGSRVLPAPPPKPTGPTATALYDYAAQTGDELGFKTGNTIIYIIVY